MADSLVSGLQVVQGDSGGKILDGKVKVTQ